MSLVSPSRWTVGRRIASGFSLILAIVAAIGVIAFARVNIIDRTTASVVDQALPGIVLLGQVQSLVKENFINTTQHVLTEDDARKVKIEKEMTAKSAALTELYARFEKLGVTSENVPLYNSVKTARAIYRDTRNAVLKNSLAHENAEARRLLEQDLYVVYQTYIKALQAMVDNNLAEAEASGALARSSVAFTKLTLVIGVSTALVTALGIAWLITRTTNRALREVTVELAQGSEQLNAAAAAISSSSQSLAQGASEQAAALQQTSATLEEISGITRRTATHSSQAKALASETRSAAETSSVEMEKMNAAMDAIKGASGNIAKIIKTIHEIAFQTNVLALNAAVEAARAGEAGLGFAVVAEEVRSLAQRSAAAAHETTERIEDSIQKSEHGVALTRSVASNLSGIVGRVREVDGLIAEIASASSSQSDQLGRILESVHQMDRLTQNTAAQAEESASASEELSAQAGSVDAMVARLDQLVSSTPSTRAKMDTPPPPAPPSPSDLRRPVLPPRSASRQLVVS